MLSDAYWILNTVLSLIRSVFLLELLHLLLYLGFCLLGSPWCILSITSVSFYSVLGISATVSLVSLCWAIAVYSRIHRRVREDKTVVSWPGVLLQAVWRIGMISSRVIALVLFATAFKAYVFVVIGMFTTFSLEEILLSGILFRRVFSVRFINWSADCMLATCSSHCQSANLYGR